MTLKIPSLES